MKIEIDMSDKKIRKTYLCQGKKVNCERSDKPHWCSADMIPHELRIGYIANDITSMTPQSEIKRITVVGKCK